MKRSLRNAVIITVVFLGGACAVQVGDIQRTEPIRIVAFTGSHVAVAQCIRTRLRAQLQDPPGEAFIGRETFVIYDRAHRYARQGMSHYSMTVKKTGANEGTVEWRIFNQQPGFELDKAFAVRFWIPVERCIEEAGKTS